MVDDDAFKFTPMNFSDSLENLEEKLNVELWYHSLPIRHVHCYETSIYIVCRPVLGDQQYNPCADIETLVRLATFIFTYMSFCRLNTQVEPNVFGNYESCVAGIPPSTTLGPLPTYPGTTGTATGTTGTATGTTGTATTGPTTAAPPAPTTPPVSP